MGQKTVFYNDLTGDELDEATAKRDVVLRVGDVEGKLDLDDVTYDALVALVHGDADGLRAVFGSPASTRRSKTEIDHIRTVAREAGYDVKDTGRLPRTVIAWFEDEYEPAHAGKVSDAGKADDEVPARRGRK